MLSFIWRSNSPMQFAMYSGASQSWLHLPKVMQHIRGAIYFHVTADLQGRSLFGLSGSICGSVASDCFQVLCSTCCRHKQ